MVVSEPDFCIYGGPLTFASQVSSFKMEVIFEYLLCANHYGKVLYKLSLNVQKNPIR